MYKVGIIGDKDSILGFKAVGFSVFPETDPAEAEKLLRQLAEEGYAVVYITEQLAKDLAAIMDEFGARRFPAVIPVPGNQGSLRIGMQAVKKSVERAVGADILSID